MVTITQQIGNTNVTIHSPSGVITMNAEQQHVWFQQQFESGNPLVRRLIEVVSQICAEQSSEP